MSLNFKTKHVRAEGTGLEMYHPLREKQPSLATELARCERVDCNVRCDSEGIWVQVGLYKGNGNAVSSLLVCHATWAGQLGSLPPVFSSLAPISSVLDAEIADFQCSVLSLLLALLCLSERPLKHLY